MINRFEVYKASLQHYKPVMFFITMFFNRPAKINHVSANYTELYFR